MFHIIEPSELLNTILIYWRKLERKGWIKSLEKIE
jgi:hypothetical protein